MSWVLGLTSRTESAHRLHRLEFALIDDAVSKAGRGLASNWAYEDKYSVRSVGGPVWNCGRGFGRNQLVGQHRRWRAGLLSGSGRGGSAAVSAPGGDRGAARVLLLSAAARVPAAPLRGAVPCAAALRVSASLAWAASSPLRAVAWALLRGQVRRSDLRLRIADCGTGAGGVDS
jgi:hypothetical protein